MGTFSGPEGGTSTLEKRQRSIKMKGILTVELQLELQKEYLSMLRKKKVLPRRFFFVLIGKDIQKDFTKIYEMLEFCLNFLSGSSTLKLESQHGMERHHAKSC